MDWYSHFMIQRQEGLRREQELRAASSPTASPTGMSPILELIDFFLWLFAIVLWVLFVWAIATGQPLFVDVDDTSGL